MTTSNTLRVVTDTTPQDILHLNELTNEELTDVGYVDTAIGVCFTGLGTFFRYRGDVYDLDEFIAINPSLLTEDIRERWDGFRPDAYTSGLVIKYLNGGKQVLVGQVSV